MNYTKKVIFVPMALFCLSLPLVAASNISAGQAMTELSASGGHSAVAVHEKTSTAQNTRRIIGLVKDENGEPVIGASVVEVGTTNGIMTDLDGKFELSIPSGGSLQISYVGYVTQTIRPGNRNNIQVVLQEDNQALDEVVVVAFGKSTKKPLRVLPVS